MSTATKESKKLLAPPVGTLPVRMRLLYITTPLRTGGWLAEAFATDSAAEVELEESTGATAGLTRVRDELFDAVLLSHEPGELDALDFVEGLRAGGSGEPMIVLGNQSEQEMGALCFEVGADADVCVNTTTTRMLIWIVARAIERHRLMRENRRLAQAEHQRLKREHQEAQHLLDQQRQLIEDLEAISPAPGHLRAIDAQGNDASPRRVPYPLPPQLVAHYREMLRAYVIMGAGNLGGEMSMLADLLATAGMSARQTMQLHVQALEDLLQGLGSRSSRHVMTRADLLVLEVIVHLAEGYRQRYQERISPAQQLLLPGFDVRAT